MAQHIVAQDGSGNFTDIQSALNAAQPGDTVYIRAGVYEVPGGLELNTPNVTVSGYPGDATPQIVAPNGADGPHAVFTFDIDADGSTIRNLDMSGGREYVVKLDTALEYDDRSFGHTGQAASNITIENCRLHDSGRDVIKVTPNCDNVKILNNEIFGSGRAGTTDDYPANNAEGIDVVNGDNIVISGNHIHHTATSGAYVKGGSKDALIENNLIEHTGLSTANVPNSGAGISLGYETDAEFYDDDNTGFVGAFNATVRNNIVRDTMDSGIQMVAAHDAVIEGNTIINAGGEGGESTRWYLGGISAYPQVTYTGPTDTVVSQVKNPTIINNIVVTAPMENGDEVWASNDPLVFSGSPDLSGAVIDGNVYWDGNGVTRFDGRTFEDHKAETGFDGNSQVMDPSDMLDANGAPIPGSALAETGAGATVADHYGFREGYEPTPVGDTTPPEAPVVTHAEDYDTEYYHGKLIYWEGSDDSVYYKVYLNGEYAGYTTASGYYLNREGTYEITVEAVDGAGNVSSVSESFSVTYGDPDANPPSEDPGTGEPGDGGDEPPAGDPVQTYPGDVEFVETPDADGIAGVHFSLPSEGEDGLLVIQFEGSSYYGYTSGAVEIRNADTGDVVFTADPDVGDAQQGQGYFEVAIPADLADGNYELVIGRQFARIELPSGEWVTSGEVGGDGWRFTVGHGNSEPPVEEPPVDEPPVEEPPVEEPPAEEPTEGVFTPIDGALGVYGFTVIDAEGDAPAQLVLHFEGRTYFGYTGGKLELIDQTTGEVVLTIDPDLGDAQQGNDTYVVELPEALEHGDYALSVGRQFARLELPSGEWVASGSVDAEDTAFTLGGGAGYTPVENVAGVDGISLVWNEAGEGVLTVHFAGTSYYGYTDGVLQVRNAATGEVVFTADPELGDAQQGSDVFAVTLPDSLPEGDYEVSLGYQFARIELPNGEWVTTGEVAESGVGFSVEPEVDYRAVEGVTGIAGITIEPASAGADGSLTLHFEGKSYFGYTGGTLEVRNAATGDLVASANPDRGDAQEGSDTFEIALPAGLDAGDYVVSVGRQFARIELPTGEWVSSGRVAGDSWTFTVAEEKAITASSMSLGIFHTDEGMGGLADDTVLLDVPSDTDGTVGIEPWNQRDDVLLPVGGDDEGTVGIEPWLQRGDQRTSGEDFGDDMVSIEPWLRDGTVNLDASDAPDDGVMGIEPWLQRGDVTLPVAEEEPSFGIEPWLMSGRFADTQDFMRVAFDLDSL